MKRVRGKNFLWITLTLMLLIGTIMVNIPVKASPSPGVTFRVGPANTSGYPIITYDVMVEVEAIADYSPEGIVGWGIIVKADPTVLTPLGAQGALSGYYLYDFVKRHWIFGGPSASLVQYIGADYMDVSEQLLPTPAYGAGDGAYTPDELVTLGFQAINTTAAYSPIDLEFDPLGNYMTPDGTWHTVTMIDGEFGKPPLEPPVASFTENATAALVGEVISFDASASYDPDGTIVSYAWDFGDGAVGSGVTVTHAYAAVGTYTVTLTVTDDDGLTDTATSEKIITELIPPVASFTEDPVSPMVGEEVTFTSTSTDADGTIVLEEWDLNGDGFIDKTGPVVLWIYDVAGDYNVILTVTDSDDLKDTAWRIKTVLPALVRDIAITDIIFSPSEVTVGDSVSINITVKNEGTETESFDISMYYDSVLIDARTSVSLDAGVTTTLTFNWNTTIEGSFTLKAVVPPVSGETDTADNELFSDAVKVHETPAPGIPLFVLAAGVVIIIVAVALAFYVFRVRKPTPA